MDVHVNSSPPPEHEQDIDIDDPAPFFDFSFLNQSTPVAQARIFDDDIDMGFAVDQGDGDGNDDEDDYFDNDPSLEPDSLAQPVLANQRQQGPLRVAIQTSAVCAENRDAVARMGINDCECGMASCDTLTISCLTRTECSACDAMEGRTVGTSSR